MIIVTKHAEKRIRKRLGVPRSAVDKIVELAWNIGLKHSDIKGSLKRYLDSVYFKECSVNNIRVYRDFLFLFSSNRLVTVFLLPGKYRN